MAPIRALAASFARRQIGNKGELNVFLFLCIAYSLLSSLFANDFRKWNVEGIVSIDLETGYLFSSVGIVRNLVDFVR